MPNDELWKAVWPLLGSAAIVAITQLQKRLWLRGYFGFGELLSGFEYGQRPGAAAVAVKLVIPVVGGMVGAIAAGDDAVPVGAAAGLFGALALTWPIFLTYDAIPDYIKNRAFELRTVYALMVLSYAGLGAVGGGFGKLLRDLLAAPDFGRYLDQIWINLVSNAIWAGVVVVASTLITRRQVQQAWELRSEGERAWSEPATGLRYPPGPDA